MDDLKEFCYKYDAYVRESSRMHRRSKRIDYKIWSESDPAIFQQIPYEDVKCVEVHMPEDRFRALVEHDSWLHNARMNSCMVGSEAVWLVKQHEKEVKLRMQYPAVQLAWEKYMTMLRLVE